MLMSDESQKTMSASASNNVLEVSLVSFGRNYESAALYDARTTNEGGASGSTNFNKFKKTKNLYYEFCKLRHHIK